MNLSEYISVSGQGGLFKVVAKANNGLIVESLADKKRIPVYATQKVSALQDISIFTNEEEVPLGDVFKKIYDKESGAAAIDSKSENEALKKYFADILPEYDRERVYVSDIKKIISWYNILQTNNLLEEVLKEEGPETNEETTTDSGEPSAEKTKKPAKAKAVKTEREKKEKTEKAVSKSTSKTVSKSTKSAPKTSTPKASKAKAGKTQTVRKTGA